MFNTRVNKKTVLTFIYKVDKVKKYNMLRTTTLSCSSIYFMV